jgi:hypothetical protein
MHSPTKCPSCRLELGSYVETHCPQCGVSLAPKPPMIVGIRLLDALISFCGILFVFASAWSLGSYHDSSSLTELYAGAPYHATTFRVISVQYTPYTAGIDGAASTGPSAYAVGIVEGQKETMDLLPYIYPRDRIELIQHFPEGTVIPVYLFPTLAGVNRIQRVGVPPAEKFQRRTRWVSNLALRLVGGTGMLMALLMLGRVFLSRNRTVAN